MKKYLLTLTTIVFFLSSCSDSELISSDQPGNTQEDWDTGAYATVPAFKQGFLEEEDVTRSTLEYKEADGKRGVDFKWGADDHIAIYSSENVLANYGLKSGSGGMQAVFEGGGFDLTAGKTYYSFSIANTALDKDLNPSPNLEKVMMDYKGMEQDGDNSCAHLGAFDYMYSKGVAQEGNMVRLNYTHLSSILRFEFTIPEAATLKRLTLEDYNVENPSTPRMLYQTRQYCNLADPAYPHLVKDDLKGEETIDNTPFCLNINNIETTAENQTVHLFMCIPAFDMRGQKIKATLETIKDGNPTNYYTSFGATNFGQGTFYNIKRTLVKAGQLNVTIRVNKDWMLGNAQPITRAGDPGNDERLNLPTHVKIYTTVNRGSTNNTFNEGIIEFDGLTDNDWIKEIDGNVYRLNKPVIIQIVNPEEDAKNVHVYAYANIDAPTINSEPTTDEGIQGMTFNVNIDGSEQNILKNLYSTTPEQGLTQYKADDVMNVDLTLYHTAAKMDFQWDATASTSTFVSFTAHKLLNTGYLFKPTENAVTADDTYTYTYNVGTNASHKYAGRHIFYAIQQGGTSWPLSVTTIKNTNQSTTDNIPFAPSSTNGWTSWLKANITIE